MVAHAGRASGIEQHQMHRAASPHDQTAHPFAVRRVQLRVTAFEQLASAAERVLGSELERNPQLVGDIECIAHLLAAAPTAHYLEWLDLASPVLAEPLQVVDGFVTAPDRPGIGLTWDTDAVERYSLS